MGGSGGRIIIQSNSSVYREIYARGGNGTEMCGTGGAGTIYSIHYRNLSFVQHAVAISQGLTGSVTPVPTPTFTNAVAYIYPGTRIYIEGGATVTPFSNNSDLVIFNVSEFDMQNR